MRQKTNNQSIFLLLTCFALATIVLTSFTDSDQCNKLLDGKYKVRFKRFPESNFVLLISKNEFTKTDKKGQQTRGTIEWDGDCYFVLSSDTVTMGDPIRRKMSLGLGNPCYELKKTAARTTSFRLTRSGNLNITLDEGRLKKVN